MTSVLQQHRVRRRQIIVQRFFLRFLMFFTMLACIGIIIFSLPQLSFRKVTVSGNETVPAEEIIHAAEEMLNEKSLYIFSRRNMFLFRSDMLEGRILSAFPVFSALEVSRSLRDGISVRVQERSLWGVYCRILTVEQTIPPAPPCFYIADDGVIFAQAPILLGNAVFRVTDMRKGIPEPRIGERAVTEEFINRVQEIAAWFSEQYQGTLREVIRARSYESDIELITSEGWYMRLDEDTCIPCALEDLPVVFGKQIKDRTGLEYVDIRFKGKVFYKNRAYSSNL